MRDRLEPAGELPVDIVGDVLGPVGADLVTERHLDGHDEMVGPEVHGPQVEQCVNSLGLFDLGAYHPEVTGAIFAMIRAVADRGTAEGTRKLTGVWPGEDGQERTGEDRSPHAASLFIPNDPWCPGPRPGSHSGASTPPAVPGDDGLLTVQAPRRVAAAGGGTIGHIPFACVHARHPGLV
jgi:hypothetical protein